MKRAVGCLLIAVCLLAWTLPALASEEDRDLLLLEAVEAVDARRVALQAFQADPQTGLRCGFFVTSATEDDQWDNPDFAFWFVLEGQAPQLVLEGRGQPLPEDEYMDDRSYFRQTIQAFTHNGHAYFIAGLRTGERQSDSAPLYMLRDGQLIPISEFANGAGYHPEVGLYSLAYDYATNPGFEAGRALTPVFFALDGDSLARAEGLRVDYLDAVQRLSNGDNLLQNLGAAGFMMDDATFYLPNGMYVIDGARYEASYEMHELFSVYVGIVDNIGTIVRYPDRLEAPDVAQPFWRVCATAEEAAVEGHYVAYDGIPGAVYPEAILTPRADRMVVYGGGAQALVPEVSRALGWYGGFDPRGMMLKGKLTALFATAKSGQATAEQIDAMAAIAGQAEPATRELFDLTLGMYRMGLLDSGGFYCPGAWCDANDNKVQDESDAPANSVNLNLAGEATHSFSPWYTFFHEAGHAIDVNLGAPSPGKWSVGTAFSQTYTTSTERYDNVTLQEAARLDVSVNLRESIAKFTSDPAQADRVFQMIWSKYPDAIAVDASDMDISLLVRSYYNYLFQGAGYTISDIYGGVTNNRIHLNAVERLSQNFLGGLIFALNKIDFLDVLEEQDPMLLSPGHFDEAYWYKSKDTGTGKLFSRTGLVPLELFAGYFSSRIRGDQEELQYYRFFLPESTQILEEMLARMLEVTRNRLP